MQKTSLLTIATMFLGTITIPTICMELVTDNSKKEQLVLELYLQKGQPNLNKVQIIQDRYHCQLLGIGWEENNNLYGVESHLFTPKESLTHYGFESICTEQIKQQFNITIPNSLPNSFVEKLKKDKTITLENDFPVQIIVHLKGIHNNPDDTINTLVHLKTIKDKALEIKKYLEDNPQITEDHVKKLQTQITDLGESVTNLERQTKKDTHSFFTKTRIFGLTIVGGFIAYLAYLHHSNQLNTQFFNTQLSHITNFINNLISNKNS